MRVARYRDSETGRLVAQRNLPYPKEKSGFEAFETETVPIGTVVERYGDPAGRYASELGASISARGMPPGSENLPLNRYRVAKPVDETMVGPTAHVPEFDAEGGRHSIPSTTR